MPKRQFPSVGCSRGAPMGRSAYGSPDDCPDRSISLFRVTLHGDYDDGGAYWGGGWGTSPLYCARFGDTYQAFYRATSRKSAKYCLGIPDYKLIRS